MKRLLFLLVPLLALTSCGGVRHVVTVSVVSAHATLLAVQQTADAQVCGQATALPAPKCLSTDQRKAIATKLSPAFATDAALATAVRDWPQGTPQPNAIPTYLAQIATLVNQVIAALPDGAAKTKLIGVLGGKA